MGIIHVFRMEDYPRVIINIKMRTVTNQMKVNVVMWCARNLGGVWNRTTTSVQTELMENVPKSVHANIYDLVRTNVVIWDVQMRDAAYVQHLAVIIHSARATRVFMIALFIAGSSTLVHPRKHVIAGIRNHVIVTVKFARAVGAVHLTALEKNVGMMVVVGVVGHAILYATRIVQTNAVI